jgi:hypothetical protein
MKEIIIDGVAYVPKNEYAKAEEFKGMKYCIVRTYSAGVFAGFVQEFEGKQVTIRDVRRIWYWSGANSLSQLAKDGTCEPDNCKFAVAVDKIIVTEAIEIIECTEKAKNSNRRCPRMEKVNILQKMS